jgi:hypothetical protein
MKIRFTTTVLIILISGMLLSFTTGFEWTQAWVSKKILSLAELRPEVKASLDANSIALVLLPKTEMHKAENGNTYLRCFLVNNTPRSIDVVRAESTITGFTTEFTTEILKNGKWLTFQYDLSLMMAQCGNSDWVQKLEPRKALSIECDHMETGSREVAFRIRYAAGERVIYSNAIRVHIDEASYNAAPRRLQI